MKKLERRLGSRVASLFAAIALFVVFTALPALAQAPDPAPEAPPGLDAAADQFVGWLKWGGLVAGVVGLFVSALMMMVGRRNRSSTAVDGATGIPWVLAGLTVMSFAAAIVGQVLS
ncbi:MAG: hypothetical protein ACT4OM_13425 [Actinomycetota bacterium]